MQIVKKEMGMPLGEILQKSFKYPWKNKALWFYGFLLAIFSSIGTASNQLKSEDYEKFITTYSIKAEHLIIGFLVFAAIIIIGVVVGSWSTVALINGTLKSDNGEVYTRKEISKVGKKTVWELIKLTVIVPMLLTFAVIFLIIPFAIFFAWLPQPLGATIGLVVAVLAVLALIPALVYFSLIWGLATRGLVVDKEGVLQSLKNARVLMRGRGWNTLLFSMVIGLISGGIGLILFFPFFILAVIGVGLYMAKLFIGVYIVIVLVVVMMGVLLAAQGYLQAFVQVAWTLWWKYLKGGFNAEK